MRAVAHPATSNCKSEIQMSRAAPRRPRVVDAKRRFVIVASQFNAPYVQGLVDHADKELGTLAPGATILVRRVPGAFEIPVVVREVASRRKADAIIACGVILKGKTNHAQNLSRSVTDALQRIAVDYGVPVINVVLSFDNETQARERCLENRINRGTEAARAAVEIANVMSDLRSS
jgi:6,7-dimethyl-8-ribityllumazine synthase